MGATAPQGRGRAGRLLERLAGGPPGRSGKVSLALFLFLLPVCALFVHELTSGKEPLLYALSLICFWLTFELTLLGGLLYYRRRTLAELLRLAGILSGVIALGLVLAYYGWEEQGWFWYSLVVFALLFAYGALSYVFWKARQ